ncbi:hypothetical protein BH10PSE19_BH10PSE19_22330 [soil metagenome]
MVFNDGGEQLLLELYVSPANQMKQVQVQRISIGNVRLAQGTLLIALKRAVADAVLHEQSVVEHRYQILIGTGQQ